MNNSKAQGSWGSKHLKEESNAGRGLQPPPSHLGVWVSETVVFKCHELSLNMLCNFVGTFSESPAVSFEPRRQGSLFSSFLKTGKCLRIQSNESEGKSAILNGLFLQPNTSFQVYAFTWERQECKSCLWGLFLVLECFRKYVLQAHSQRHVCP